ncbi:MAG: TlpA family protein disulfide reductase [Bacteroidales bacterium]|nr:TlpA family protein disulfide reductase [Bacteroidales bacterium]
MKKLLLILTILLPMIVSAQKTIENPVIGAKGIGTLGLAIEKIVLQNDMTKLYMVYYHGQGGSFNMNGTSRIVANGKELKVISSEGIELNGPYIQKFNNEETHFVLNFPALDKDVDKIDFIEDYCLQCFKIFDIAISEKAVKENSQKSTVPDEVRNYAKSIKDNGQSLEKNDFTFDTAVVKGKIYGFDIRIFGDKLNPEIVVYFYNPFLAEQLSYSGRINHDGTFEVKVPMTNKHQAVYVSVNPIISSDILISAGKTVEVYFDFLQIYKPWELPESRLIPYFAGENVDINYALSLGLSRNLYQELIINPNTIDNVSKFSMAEFKDYVLNFFDNYNSRIDAIPVTKRAKEFLRIDLKVKEAYYLSMGSYWIESAYRNIHGKGYKDPIPDFKRPEIGTDYLDYPKLLGIDDVMMFYANDFGYNITGWSMCFEQVFNKYRYLDEYVALNFNTWMELDKYHKIPKKEQSVFASVKRKMKDKDTSRTEAEKAFTNKYARVVDQHIEEVETKCAEGAEDYKNEIFGEGGSYFKDFIKLQEYCRPFSRQTVVPDSIVAEIEKMRFPFYAEYVKAKNAEIFVKIEAEKARGGYHVHKAGESEGDSLFVDLIKDFKGKVVLVDFWNTWCGPCRQAIKQMEPLEKYFEGKDVEFLFVADETSPIDEYNSMIVSMKGHHYRLTESQASSLKRKWNFNGIPSYVIIGKDGMVKDFHTGFHGAEYYSQKIEEELKK